MLIINYEFYWILFFVLNVLLLMIFFCRKKMLMCFDEDICIVMCIKIFKFLVDFNLLVNLVLEMRIVYLFWFCLFFVIFRF